MKDLNCLTSQGMYVHVCVCVCVCVPDRVPVGMNVGIYDKKK